MEWGESGFKCCGSGDPRSCYLFLLYVNVSGMHPWTRFSSQPLMILAPWVFLRIWWSIPLVPLWVTASCLLVGSREAELKPNTFSSLLLFRFFLFFLFT